MTTCDFCGDEFSDKTDLRVHWGEEHEDELNSHQQDQVKKARKKQEKQKQQRKQRMARRRKQVAVYGLGAIAVAFLFYFMYSSLTFTTYATNTGEGVTFNLSDEPMMGQEDANVTVVEFGDYKCPVCKQFHQTVLDRPNTDQDLKGQYIETGKVKFYFMNFPFLGPDSYTAAQATECVYNQDEEQFWNMQDAIYENQGSEAERWATQTRLMELARQHTSGLDYDQLQACIANSEESTEVSQDKTAGNAAGVKGTPSVYVNGRKLSQWGYSTLSAAIDAQLN